MKIIFGKEEKQFLNVIISKEKNEFGSSLFALISKQISACVWHHNFRKLLRILVVIENAYDYGPNYTIWTAIQNWNLR
jgi:hypothetical protein